VTAAGAVLLSVRNNEDSADSAPLVREFPPGTITAPSGDEINCGEYTVGLDAQLGEAAEEDAFAQEHRCFLDALASGTPAVLVEHSGTVEGDPIRQQVRVVGPTLFDHTYDATLDNFGSGTVDTATCTELVIQHSAIIPKGCDHGRQVP
jgi:hypothetical protein